MTESTPILTSRIVWDGESAWTADALAAQSMNTEERPRTNEAQDWLRDALDHGAKSGKDLFKAYCASCHGSDAKGKGPMATSLRVQPADLTRISIRNRDVFPMMRVQKIISGEELLPSGHGSREITGHQAAPRPAAFVLCRAGGGIQRQEPGGSLSR